MKTIIQNLKPYLYFYFRYIIFFLFIQIVFRIIFLIVYRDLDGDAGIQDWLMTLAYGMKLDVSITGYILLFPTLILIFYTLIISKSFKKILGVYTLIMQIVLILALFTNLVIYRYWRTPADDSIFDYLSTPKEMLASVSTWSLVALFLILGLTIYALYFQIYRKWVSKALVIPQNKSVLGMIIMFLLLPSLIIPMRGGLGSSTINIGSVYFHQNSFLNHAAVNPAWSIVYSLTEKDNSSTSDQYYPDLKVREFTNDLFEHEKSSLSVLNTKRPNIIIIILESFGQAIITKLGGDGSAAPNLNSLMQEGIFFKNFYATGTLTDRALGAILAGYPSLPGTAILRDERKGQKLPRLNHSLKKAGYSSSFLYGGDIDFGHFRSFLMMGEFEKILSQKNFPPALSTSKWGVPDHHLFHSLAEESDNATSPFFHVLLTLSSHYPFDVPMEPVFEGSDHLTKFKNSVYYTDQSLGEFIETAKTKDWWEETLVILVADHGCRLEDFTSYEKRRFNIPMLWLGGALNTRDTIINKIGSQIDITVTLLSQLGLPKEDFHFGKDLFSNDSKSFAYYTYSDGIGFLHDSSYSIYSLITEDYIQNDSPDSTLEVDPGLAFLQYLVKDFSEK
jgi:phosphoglycerol transferase MdoB-like AlkP superfamily enzyme